MMNLVGVNFSVIKVCISDIFDKVSPKLVYQIHHFDVNLILAMDSLLLTSYQQYNFMFNAPQNYFPPSSINQHKPTNATMLSLININL